MSDTLQELLTVYLAPIGVAFLIAWLLHKVATRMAARVGRITGHMPKGLLRMREERQRTLNDLVTSLISFLAFLTATIFALGRFIDATTLIWMIGLFSAAFGLGARPLIADFLTGMSFMFEDTVQIGEKVEIMNIQGIVEKINLRTMTVRAQSGELYVIPNGEVRVIRNFSRGKFSSSQIMIRVASDDLPRAIPLLKTLGQDAVTRFSDITEPWRIINNTGALGQHVELTLLIKAQFGHAADLRLDLLVFIQEQLAEAGIALVA